MCENKPTAFAVTAFFGWAPEFTTPLTWTSAIRLINGSRWLDWILKVPEWKDQQQEHVRWVEQLLFVIVHLALTNDRAVHHKTAKGKGNGVVDPFLQSAGLLLHISLPDCCASNDSILSDWGPTRRPSSYFNLPLRTDSLSRNMEHWRCPGSFLSKIAWWNKSIPTRWFCDRCAIR